MGHFSWAWNDVRSLWSMCRRSWDLLVFPWNRFLWQGFFAICWGIDRRKIIFGTITPWMRPRHLSISKYDFEGDFLRIQRLNWLFKGKWRRFQLWWKTRRGLWKNIWSSKILFGRSRVRLLEACWRRHEKLCSWRSSLRLIQRAGISFRWTRFVFRNVTVHPWSSIRNPIVSLWW
jgi:hypothetical protein